MKVVLDMIQSKKEYEESQKEKLLQEYKKAVENGEDVVALLLSDYLREINHTLDFLDIQEQVVSEERNYYEFTFDLTGADIEYSKIKKYMLEHGFEWKRDSDYITVDKITRSQMLDIEQAIKTEFPWFLEMSTKIYDAVVTELSDVRARWLEEEDFGQELDFEMEDPEVNYLSIEDDLIVK